MNAMIELNIDSTSLGSSDCILKFKRVVIGELDSTEGGYKTLMGASAIYGVAVHKFVDVMFKTRKGSLAKAEAEKSFNIPKLPPPDKQQYLGDAGHMINTCYNLWTQQIEEEKNFEVLQIPTKCYWCNNTANIGECSHCLGAGIVQGPATELTFRIPFYEDEIVRIFLCGTIDTVGKFKGGCFAIRDWKTTSTWNKTSYLEQYEMSRQLRIYTLACKLMSRIEPDSILGKVGASNMGAFIDAIFVKTKANDNEYGRTDVMQFKQDDLELFERSLREFCVRLSLRIHNNQWPKEGILNGACLGKFNSPCMFWNVCKNNDTVGQLLLKRDFKRKVYNPLAFNE